jgi:hypothetical protein
MEMRNEIKNREKQRMKTEKSSGEKNDLLYIECTELSKLLTEQSIYTERMNYNSSTN